MCAIETGFFRSQDVLLEKDCNDEHLEAFSSCIGDGIVVHNSKCPFPLGTGRLHHGKRS